MGSLRSALGWIIVTPLLATVAACGAGAEGDASSEPTSSTSSAIYGGTIDDDGNANPAVVAVKVGNSSPFTLCTGVLIGPNVVLTAWHCLAQSAAMSVTCDASGDGGGPQLGADQPISAIHVFVGSTPSLLGIPSANVTKIFHPPGDVLCNGDVALVTLDQPIANITPLRVRLVAATSAGEAVRVVGYGQNDQNLPIGTRMRKDALPILAVGSTVSASGTPLASHEFEVGVSMCEGDSGAPAISEKTGAVMGVVSRGGACTDDFGHIYTETSAFSSLVAEAFAFAGGAVVEEQAPKVTPGTDASVTDDAGAPVPSSSAPPASSPPPGSTPSGPVNLRSGAGSGCSIVMGRGRATRESEPSWAGVGAFALAFAFVRKRRDRGRPRRSRATSR